MAQANALCGSPAYRKPAFDLHFPRALATYDKMGCGLLIKRIKLYLFSDSSKRITKTIAENFFDDPNNFL